MRILSAGLATVVLLGSGCGSDDDGWFTYAPTDGPESSVAVDTQGVNAGDCDGVDVGGEGDVVALYSVSGGAITSLCSGSDNDLLVQTWEKLADVSPAVELASITALAGFESDTSDTAAFTAPLFDNNEAFVVAVNLSIAGDDADESQLTMVHELAHVFTLEQDQIDFQADSTTCETFYNGSGCFFEDSYIVSWIEQFWNEEQIGELPADGSVDEAGGEGRCAVDQSFLGGYAASHPEEDFAESFSAFVFAVDTDPGVSEKLAFFEDYPELVAFRDKAISAGESGLRNNFGVCG